MSRLFQLLLTPVLIVIYWQILSSSGLISPYLLPTPLKVWQAAINMFETGVLQKHIIVSLIRVLSGFALSCLLGVILAGFVSSSIWIERLLSAPITLLRMIPPLAMVPLLILWLGIGNETQLTIIILASIFPIFLNTRDGLKRVDATQKELAKSLNLSPIRYVFAIVIPNAIPSFVTGFRLAFGYSWRALVGAELIAASSGLGYLIVDAQEMLRTDEVIVGILTIGILGWMLDSLINILSKKLLAHRFPEVAN
ncbi:ABC transporter permease [Orbus mooreae]|uniref:ABC transporter permease n=1 Tax=Orbus mooreae TaxID=3074107 RepID=UPI00370DAF9F